MEKRNPRSYKIADKPYLRAKKRANDKLATIVETLVTEYGLGHGIYIMSVDEERKETLRHYFPHANTKLKSSNKK